MPSGSGQCLCGAVRFTAKDVETHYHACHCGMCRRWAGGPSFSASASGVEFKGAENILRYDSSEWAERGSCKRCGGNLFYYLKPADQYMMCVGTFDEPKGFELVGEIFIDHKPDGYAFAGNLPKQTEAEILALWEPNAKE
ncbi:MAG: GFA family protein [Dongiaceae bacterium]